MKGSVNEKNDAFDFSSLIASRHDVINCSGLLSLPQMHGDVCLLLCSPGGHLCHGVALTRFW